MLHVHVQYHHFMLECRLVANNQYQLWIIQDTGCIVFQKTKEEEYSCYFNVLVYKGIVSMTFSASFNPVFAHNIYYNEYYLHLYTVKGFVTARYAQFKNTKDIDDIENLIYNCTKILLYEYESSTFIQTMFYQMKLVRYPAIYPQFTMNKNGVMLKSTSRFAFIRMIVDPGALVLQFLIAVANPFLLAQPHNIYYMSFNVTQCQKNSPGMILILSAKLSYSTEAWYRDTYTFLAPAAVLPIIKVPFQYVDIYLYYLKKEAISCIVNIDYRYYPLSKLENPDLMSIHKSYCKYMVSD